MLEGAKRRASMCQAYYRTSYIRARYIVPVSSNFLNAKFRVESGRSAAKLALCKEIFNYSR